MLDEAQLRRFPMLAASALPEAERPHGSIIWSQLSTPGTLLLRLQHALQLFDYCAEEIAATRVARHAARSQRDPMQLSSDESDAFFSTLGRLHAWMWIAGRDGAFAIWDFVNTIESVRKNLLLCPTLVACITMPDLEALQDDIALAFPFCEEIRHAAAHEHDLRSSVRDRDKNAFSGEYRGFGVQTTANTKNGMIQGLSGRSIGFTYRQQVVEYELSETTLDQLEVFRKRFNTLFAAAEAVTQNLMLAQMQRRAPE